DVLRAAPDGKFIDDLERRRIDDVDVVRAQVRYVYARERPPYGRTEAIDPRFAVQVRWIDHARHAGYRLHGRGVCAGRREGHPRADYHRADRCGALRVATSSPTHTP